MKDATIFLLMYNQPLNPQGMNNQYYPIDMQLNQPFYHETPPYDDILYSMSVPIFNQTPVDDSEKKKKRRESHNAVERRRRDHINDQIIELSALLPTGSLVEKQNKGVVLKKSVDYIKHLQVSYIDLTL